MSARRVPVSKGSRQQASNTRPSVSNPFDSDTESEMNTKPTRASSGPVTSRVNQSLHLSDHEDEGRRMASSSLYSGYSAAKNRYKNDFRDSGGIENQSVQELENYAAYKAEETTSKLNDCMKIVVEMREDASKTLVTLHQQGEQINQTHSTAANMEYDLSRGEKLLGSLGGIFSKKWKPKKNREIKGPRLTRDDSFIRKGSHMEQRQRLGLSTPLPQTEPRRFTSEPNSALEKVEIEKAKQDDTLSDLSDMLGELKNMAIDMGSEIERQTVSLGHMQDDVEELSFRVKGANQRGRRLLGK